MSKPFPTTVKPGAKIILDPDTRYVLDKPWIVPTGITIDTKGGDPKHAATIECKNAGAGDYDALIIRNGSKDVSISNVVIDATPKLRAINNGGDNCKFKNIRISDSTFMALIFMGATNSTIDMSPGFSQRSVTLKGYTYFTGCTNCWLKRVETYGDFYENEHRFHNNQNCGIEDLTVYGANPENNVDLNHDGQLIEGAKDNGLRVHDGTYTIKKVFGTGNARFGVMNDDDGGINDYRNAVDPKTPEKEKQRLMAEYLRKMSLSSSINVGSLEWYGLVRLESNLIFNCDSATIYVTGGDSVIRVDPDYVAGSRIRKAAVATFKALAAYNVSIPGAVKKAFSKPTDVVDACRDARGKSKFNVCSIRSGQAGKVAILSGGVNQK